ncbi:MAG TPA: hypothetical protein VF894_12335 [Anaeromyxobacter sp.]
MRFALALAVASLSAALPAAARAESGVDWQRKVVKCTGSGAANLRDAGGNPAVARIGAEKAAKLDALRNCMEALKGVQLQSGQTVGGALKTDQALTGRVEGLVRGFKVAGAPRYFSDGGVELDVEVPLEGALSDALLPKAEPKPEAKPDPKPAKSEGAPSGTSLVVDARGQKVVPALAPRILDEAGKVIYGPASLGAAGRKVGGAAAYANDLAAAKASLKERIGDTPYVVKAVRAEGSDLVISSVDAAGLAGKDLGFLADAKVVILAD